MYLVGLTSDPKGLGWYRPNRLSLFFLFGSDPAKPFRLANTSQPKLGGRVNYSPPPTMKKDDDMGNERDGGEERRGLPGVGSATGGLTVELVERTATGVIC